MVKQFSNFAIDNAYSFVFKIIDFGKILNLLFWGFVDIWAAFFGVFYNFFMYLYYLFLFMIDKGSESTAGSLLDRKRSQNFSKIPSIAAFEKSPSVVTSMYKKPKKSATPSAAVKPVTAPAAPAAPKTTATVQSSSSSITPGTSSGTLAPLKPSTPGKGAKKSIFKTIWEFIVEYVTAIKNLITKPFKFIANKLKPVKETEAKNIKSAQGTSLIDQYMKEYEKKKR